MKYQNLEAACGGAINPETLVRFEKAMREYQEFMVDLRKMLGPATRPGLKITMPLKD